MQKPELVAYCRHCETYVMELDEVWNDCAMGCKSPDTGRAYRYRKRRGWICEQCPAEYIFFTAVSWQRHLAWHVEGGEELQ